MFIINDNYNYNKLTVHLSNHNYNKFITSFITELFHDGVHILPLESALR